jgi:VanZ family protein
VLKKNFIYALSIFYTIALTILSLIPLKDLPNLNTGFDDKIGHFLFYAILCMTWFLSFHSLKIKRSLFAATAFSILFGLIIELLQGEVSYYRTTDVYDFLANTLGTLTMATLIQLKKEVIIKKL